MRLIAVALVLAPLSALPAEPSALEQLLLEAAARAASAPVAPASPAEPRSYANSRIVKVLSYNIKANPAAFLEGYESDRFRIIGERLAARRGEGGQPDFVVLQESFTRRARDLRAAAGYPHEARGPRADGRLLDAGLYLLSDHPIEAVGIVDFQPKTCRSWDCLANKGALVARVRISGVPFPIDLATTHLQAGGKPKSDGLRVEQIDRALDMLAANRSPGAPLIFAGDFNSSPERAASYGPIMDWSGLSNAGADCLAAAASCRVAEGTRPETLVVRSRDQHLYTPGGRGYRLRPVYAERAYPLDEMLSDHLAYEIHYLLEW